MPCSTVDNIWINWEHLGTSRATKMCTDVRTAGRRLDDGEEGGEARIPSSLFTITSRVAPPIASSISSNRQYG